MMTRLISLLILLAPLAKVAGDIIPNPIKAKGIVPAGNLQITLKWERVVVDLYKDSSVVECHFFLKNEGKSQKINIGFPEMNFYHFNFGKTQKKLPGNFTVHEDDKRVNNIELYSPDIQNQIFDSSLQANLNLTKQENYSEKPWFLWDSKFEEFTNKLITVKYSLPHGALKNGCRYFTYLLSTGFGWKGNIDSAEIIVNLMDIDSDLILQTMPANYSQDKNQLKWSFTNFEPTPEHDIKITYEPNKGYYESYVAKHPSPIWVIDGNKVIGTAGFIEPGDLLSIRIIKDQAEKAKYTTGNEDVVVVINKSYAIKKFIDEIISVNLKSHTVQNLPPCQFITNYDLKIDEEHFSDQKMLQKLPEIVPNKIRKVRIQNNGNKKTTIQLMTRKGN